MELRVLGCHGGETPHHRTSSFVVDDTIAIDAGALTSGLTVEAQCALRAVLVSHAHLDHVRDLATIADNRAQNGCAPLTIAGPRETIAALKKHFFNDLLWPDFTKIPNTENPTIVYEPLRQHHRTELDGYIVTAIPVTHTIDCSAFLLEDASGATIAYSGDTGPTNELWEALNDAKNLRALLMEVSFPSRLHKLAKVSGHHTPETLEVDLKKYKNSKELPTMLYHMKPTFLDEMERECMKIRGRNLVLLKIGDQFIV